MSMHNAIRFLRDIDSIDELRHELYLCGSYDELFATLAKAGYSFTGAEFEEMVDHLHVSCETTEEADILMGKANWFRMVSANT